MNMIYIKKSGFFVMERNTELKTDRFQKIESELAYHMQDIVTIDDDVTIENIMDSLMEFEKEVDILFMGHTRGFKLKPFYEKMQEPLKEGDSYTDLDFIEFHWGTDYTEYDDEVDDEEKPSFYSYVSFHGVDDSVEIQTFEESRYYGMSLSPVNRWKHLPVKMDKTFFIRNYVLNKDTNVYEEKVLMEAEKEFTFYELIGGFLHEMSWHGYPENQEEISNKLEEVSLNFEEGDFVPFEEVHIDLRRRELEIFEAEKAELLEAEAYEKISEVDKKIEKCKLKIKELEEELERNNKEDETNS
jgi:hypothetical protein